MNASGGVGGYAMLKSDMYKKYEQFPSHKYYANYMIMKSNMTMMVCVMIKRNGGSSVEIYLEMAMEMP